MTAFRRGRRTWIEQPDGYQRPGTFVGEAGNASWFGGQPGAYVVYAETRSGEEVALIRITPRDDEVEADATRPG